MGHVTDEEDLAPGVAPLSAEEQRWIKSLERVLKKMPPRLLMIEIGDAIQIVDRDAATPAHGPIVHLEDGKAQEAGIMLGTVDHSIGVLTGVSG